MPENYPQSKKCPVAIIGRREDTCNYEAALSRLGIPCFTTLSPNKIYSCGGSINVRYFINICVQPVLFGGLEKGAAPHSAHIVSAGLFSKKINIADSSAVVFKII